jgi:hypothetical protein
MGYSSKWDHYFYLRNIRRMETFPEIGSHVQEGKKKGK